MNYSAILKKDPRVENWFPGRPGRIEIPETVFQPESEARQTGKYLLQFLQDFLQKFILTDNFAEHGERRQWMKELEAEYGVGIIEYLRGNALRKNSFQQIVAGTAFWEMLLQTLTLSAAHRITPLVQQIKDADFLARYDELSNAEKVTRIRRLQEKVFQLLTLLAR